MRVLDLFSGIGGFSLGLERAGFETVAFCEINRFCQEVLKKHWPEVPIFNDVRTLPDEFKGTVDVITGGYPCQPFSTAGKRKAEEDSRHLWPAMFACIKKFKPAWVIAENVAGHITLGLDRVLVDLESEAYTCETFIIPACAIGAPHRRDRLWIIAYSHDNATLKARGGEGISEAESPALQAQRQAGEGQTVQYSRCDDSLCESADSNDLGREGGEHETVQRQPRESRQLTGGYQEWRNGWPVSSPLVCRVDDGIPDRVDRLKSLGNAVVPQIPEIIGNAIKERIKCTEAN